MGANISASSIIKVDERQRAHTHKLVNLVEARKQFAKLIVINSAGESTNDWPLDKFHTHPVLRNFQIDFHTYSRTCRPVLHMQSSKGIEVDGRNPEWATVYHLLRNYKTSPAIIPENYYLGLDKEQYDALYPSTSSMLSTSTATTTVIVT